MIVRPYEPSFGEALTALLIAVGDIPTASATDLKLGGSFGWQSNAAAYAMPARPLIGPSAAGLVTWRTGEPFSVVMSSRGT